MKIRGDNMLRGKNITELREELDNSKVTREELFEEAQ